MSIYSCHTTLGALKSTINSSEFSWPLSGHLRSLDDLTLEEITDSVKEMTLNNIHIQLENEIYFNYLTRTEPYLLLRLQEDLDEQERADKRHKKKHSAHVITSGNALTPSTTHWKSKVEERTSLFVPVVRPSSLRFGGKAGKEEAARLSVYNPSVTSSVLSFALNTTSGHSSNLSSLKVSFSIKTELVSRAIDLRQVSSTARTKDYLSTMAKLNTNRQQLEMALADTRNAHMDFQTYVLSESKENIAHRIPAEYFIVFMEKWFKKAEKEICTLGLKVQKYQKIFLEKRQTLRQRRELVDNLSPIDVQVVLKDISDDRAELETKIASVLELRTICLPLERNVLIFKNQLQAQVEELKKTSELVKKRAVSLAEMERHIEKTQTEVEHVRARLVAFRGRLVKYERIDVMGYLHVKLEVARLKKEIKSWKRRNTVQHMNLKANTRIANKIKRQNNYLKAMYMTGPIVH